MDEKGRLAYNFMARQAAGDFFKRSAKRLPEKTALTFRDHKFTYNEFNRAVNRAAHALQALGLQKGDALAIMSQNCHQMVIIMCACFKTGVWYAPVNFLLRGHEIIYQVNHSDAKVFFVESAFLDAVNEVSDELKTVQKYSLINLAGVDLPKGWIDADDLFSEKHSEEEPDVIINGDDVASIIYTSGTTGAPKGALISNSSYFSQTANFICPPSAGAWFEEKDISMMNIPLYHIGASSIFVAAAKAGATTHFTYGVDPFEALGLIGNEKVTSLVWPPTLYTELLKMPLEKYDLSSLRKCAWFGGSMPLKALRKWMELCPEAVFCSHWSQTEINITGTFGWLMDGKLPESGNIIGKPCLDTEIRIVDENDKDVSPGDSGEIVVRSPSVMLGYYKDEAKTAETFRNGWLHTGDVGYQGKYGNYYYMDRVKDMVKSGGENVSCLEVEAILNGHPEVQVSAVFGAPHPHWIEGVTAAVVRKSEELTEQDLVEYARGQMAKFKVPKKIIFINYDELPLNPTGKILKKELRKVYKDVYKDVKGK